MTYLGEAAALGTALCFAVSSLSFGFASRAAGGLAVNQFRILLATALLLVANLLATGTLWPTAGAERIGLLLASGLVGLTLGDLGYFHALAVIGPRLASVLMATWPSMALGIAWAWSGLVPSAAELAGVGLTTLGVVLVLLRAGEGAAWNPDLGPAARAAAIGAGLFAALGQATGFVIADVAIAPAADLPAGVAPLSASAVRMVAGCAGILVLGASRGRLLAFLAVPRRRVVGHALAGTMLGPMLGIWLSLVALQHAATGTAAALIVTTPLFLMPISRVGYGARIGWFGAVGTVLTVAGAALLVAAAGSADP